MPVTKRFIWGAFLFLTLLLSNQASADYAPIPPLEHTQNGRTFIVFPGKNASVEFEKTGRALYHNPITITLKGKKIKLAGFSIRHGLDKRIDERNWKVDVSGTELNEFSLSSDYRKADNKLVIIQNLGSENRSILYEMTAEQGTDCSIMRSRLYII